MQQVSRKLWAVQGARRVVSNEFVGVTAIVLLETDTGEELKVQKSHDELARIDMQPGLYLQLHCEPGSCHALPEE